MKIVFCGGGTAGHINPSLALAEELSLSGDCEIFFISREGGDENRLIKYCGYSLFTLKVKGLSKSVTQVLSGLYLAFRAKYKAKKLLKELKPDVVFATGGYVSFPVLSAANALGIRTILHESNAASGLVSRLFSRRVSKVLLGVEDLKYGLHRLKNASVVGTPVKMEFDKTNKRTARASLGIRDDEFLIVSAGGSLGAKKLNETMLEVMRCFSTVSDKIRHFHSVGRRYYEELSEQDRKLILGVGGCKVLPYINSMPTYLSAADLVISRCGAVSVAEICAVGVPAILIPSPNVTDDHQRLNARALSLANAASVIEEDELSSEKCIEEIKKFVNDKSLRKNMAVAQKHLFASNAREHICSIIKGEQA